ncbi:MAG: tRNA (N6-threonylcarbamoyladenosine(37)-N6)-methyltransferase TrmO [Bdellovibrionaceae bacterium]|nr:tRNA (N6-threonylcarbamoyladenosine(37)-N6)-methyltransferase TrmO [Pseudobdellovibrionaceae bacterium]
MKMEPIGFYYSEAKAPYEAPRQPLERIITRGEIILKSGQQFEQALENLEGFERIWLIYQFHHNNHWKPKVLPPRGSPTKVGVFATRAPYRPNPIGMSCVRLIKVKGLKLVVEGADLLDQTPLLDIKPYLPYADSFADSKMGWLEGVEKNSVQFTSEALEKINFLSSAGLTQMKDFILNQLEYDALNAEKKRVSKVESDYLLAYKTWRIKFSYNQEQKNILVLDITSGYSQKDWSESADSYGDKTLHQHFLSKY